MALMRVKPGPKPDPNKHRRPKTPRERDEYAKASIEKQLDAARTGKQPLNACQLKAIEIRYSRLRPLLSSIEQTQQDPRDMQDPAQLQAKLQALLDANPGLLEALIAADARARRANEQLQEEHRDAA